MFRHINRYLERLVDEERFAFYQAVCDFADKEIAPHLLTWGDGPRMPDGPAILSCMR